MFAKKPLIIAHRGASELAPENTLAAFRKAIEDGAEGIEFDVRLSKDGVPVVFHDAFLDRLAQTDGKVIDHSVAELKQLDIGSWFNAKFPKQFDPSFSRERIPTLIELLDFLSDFKGLVYVELKCKKEETSQLVKSVCDVISSHILFPQIIVKCFSLKAIVQARVMLPEVKTAALFAPKILNVFRKKRYLLDEAEVCLANEISLHYSLATKSLVSRAQKLGLQTTIWTADNPRWVNRAAKLGLKSIITNNPARLLETRDTVVL